MWAGGCRVKRPGGPGRRTVLRLIGIGATPRLSRETCRGESASAATYLAS